MVQTLFCKNGEIDMTPLPKHIIKVREKRRISFLVLGLLICLVLMA